MIKISMPYYPEVSVNRAYKQSRHGRRYLDPTAAGWKMAARTKTLRALEYDEIELTPGSQIIIELDARFPKQVGRRPDGDNFLKLAQDAIADAFEVDDHICLARVRSVKHNHDMPGLDYEIRLLKD